jgi:hypothetical protein
MNAPVQVLARLAARYRMERALSRLLGGAAAGLVLAGLAHYAGGGVRGVLLGLATGIAGGMLAAWLAERQWPVDARTLARHLDRTLPELEESATLLLDPPGLRGTLVELQRARVERRWDPERARTAVPRAQLRQAAAVGVPIALAGALLLLSPPSPRGMRTVWAVGGAGPSLTLRTLEVEIVPPDYTGAPTRRQDGTEIEAEEGARLVWRLATAGPVDAAWLIPSSGDSLRFEPDGGDWRVACRAERSLLLRVRLQHGDSLTLTSDDYHLAVRPDRPPMLTIVRPEERTSYDPATLPAVPVEVLANDDYGLDSIAISATIASGQGEAVRFRRMRLPYTERKRREGHGELVRAILDLRALGLGAGDELYFNVEATDGKVPVPNRSRSETVFISIRDSSTALSADLAPLAIGAQPEYFRSQRQLIIDTERLLADQARIAQVAFRERSNELGMDQGLLRLRYGQFLGEEFEEELQPMGGREHAAQVAQAPDEQPPPETGDETPPPPAAAKVTDAPQKKAADRFTHRHDDAENATLLALSVKDKLRAAVGAMWRSELYLRTGEPKRALPFMYQALELIKQVQQDARVYVQRVGFDPPPIEVDRLRLTGKLEDIRDRNLQSRSPHQDSLPAVRAALELLLAVNPPTVNGGRLRAALIAAEEEVTGVVLTDPRLLPVLRALRQLADSLEREAPCPGCAQRAAEGLWSALPRPEPTLGMPPPRESPLARRFATLLKRSGE